MNVSIIIPVYNEAAHILTLLEELKHHQPDCNTEGNEVIVVDGGSDDGTAQLVADSGWTLLAADKGRASQMNAAAAVASGDVLLFLHADTRLPKHAIRLIQETILNDNVWGRFNVRLSGSGWLFRLIETMMNLRSCITSVATGDQAIFVKRSLFVETGGFPAIALMEDVALSKQLRRVKRAACIKDVAITSSRRWENNRVIKTVVLMWRLRLLYFFGVSPATLARLYR